MTNDGVFGNLLFETGTVTSHPRRHPMTALGILRFETAAFECDRVITRGTQ